MRPFFGIQLALIDQNVNKRFKLFEHKIIHFYFKGNELKSNNTEGLLVIKKPWPSMAMTIFEDHQRFIQTYLKPFKGSFL